MSVVGYDRLSQTLEVQFHRGSVYRYEHVPEAMVESLMTARSLGQYFSQNIRNAFRCKRVR